MKIICEWSNCNEVGKCKAPMEKDNIKNFRWLCENHIKLFNKKWNYFEGMSQIEITNLNFTYSGRLEPTLNQINITVEKGDFILLNGKTASGKSTLLKAINSVLNQTHTNVEFLIADDCSTNRTRSVLSSNSI